MSGRRPVLVFAIAVLLTGLAPQPMKAGNPLTAFPSGRPITWPDGGRNILYQTDLGALGPMTNAEAVAQTVSAFQQWEDVPTATPTYLHAGSLGINVDASNFAEFLFPPPGGISTVVYDADGSIFELLFGIDIPIFYGFATSEQHDAVPEYSAVNVFLNGRAIGYPLERVGLTVAQFAAVQLHEIGHLNGLAHSVVNGEIVVNLDETGPSPQSPFPAGPAAHQVETMYAFLLAGAGQETLDRDDLSAFSALYPEPLFTVSTGIITGRVLGLDGLTPLNGVNVIARNLDAPFADAVSSISGSYTFGSIPAAEDPFSGFYKLSGLTPGARYVIYIDALEDGAFPRRIETPPGPEEFYNGVLESSDPDIDDPTEFTAVVPVAGQTLEGIDFLSNRLRPGVIPIDSVFLERDNIGPFQEFALPFAFSVCGAEYHSVFLNVTAGTLSLGAPDRNLPIFADWTFKFLTGPPQIAAMTAEYTPEVSGTVAFWQTSQSFTLEFTRVPSLDIASFESRGSNSFAITLSDQPGVGSTATVRYGDLEVSKGLAGFSCGGNMTSRYEAESDLSAMAQRPIGRAQKAAVFEEFASADFDLQQTTLHYELPRGFQDQQEPNQSLGQAVNVNLPFDTSHDFTTVAPGDVDFYRFRARRGDLVVAETIPGAPLDTLLGLFDSQGTLLTSNDDLSGRSFFSRVQLRAPVDGEYIVAVTTFGDSEFTGDGFDSGRYVLTIDAFEGETLPLNADDVTIEIPLGFAFPFQGRVWNSVWVSSNGSVTFGAPEQVLEVADLQLPGFLNGPPRIAPYFTDLDPSGSFNGRLRGSVLANWHPDGLTIHWVSIAKILDAETNSFSLTLRPDGEVLMNWRAGRTSDVAFRRTLVGITTGNGTPDPGPTDLSRVRSVGRRNTVYEVFDRFSSVGVFGVGSDPAFDLSFTRLKFSAIW